MFANTNNYHHYLNTIEDDIPEKIFPIVAQSAYSRIREGAHIKYLLGLFLLHNNRHIEALNYFQDAIKEYPSAVYPKLYYIITSLEICSPSNSEVGYYRDFYLFQLGQLDSNYIQSIFEAYAGLSLIWGNKKLQGIERIKRAEVLAGDFYPTILLITRGYIGVGDRKNAERYKEALLRRYPRLKQIESTAFSAKPL